jgi:hypothetical protein
MDGIGSVSSPPACVRCLLCDPPPPPLPSFNPCIYLLVQLRKQSLFIVCQRRERERELLARRRVVVVVVVVNIVVHALSPLFFLFLFWSLPSVFGGVVCAHTCTVCCVCRSGTAVIFIKPGDCGVQWRNDPPTTAAQRKTQLLINNVQLLMCLSLFSALLCSACVVVQLLWQSISLARHYASSIISKRSCETAS